MRIGIRHIVTALLSLALVCATPFVSLANQKTVHVREYTRKDGTKVAAHDRKAHIIPLACGGSDTPANMQWQTIAEGKAKDRTERANCR